MNIEEIKIGMTASCSKQITDLDIKIFSELSGDSNPIHFDDNYAKSFRLKKRVAHGIISASLFSGLLGTKLPGCLYVSQTLNFKRPIYIDDTITATIEVVSINMSTRHVFLKTLCVARNRIAISGEADIFIPKDVFSGADERP